MASVAGMPLSFSLISANTGGFTKRATVSAMILIAYCVGNIIGPFLFFEREAPHYKVSQCSRTEERTLPTSLSNRQRKPRRLIVTCFLLEWLPIDHHLFLRCGCQHWGAGRGAEE